jgi:hypothetical protein
MKHEFKVIPKEEILSNRSNAYEFINFDKQETLEEAAKNYSKGWGEYDDKKAFIAGVKWQQEQDKNKFSEEEVLELLNDLRLHTYNYGMGRIELLEWFEQSKNK